MTRKWESTEPESAQQGVLKAVEEILSQVNTQNKVDHVVLALLKKEKHANPNITDKER